MDLEGGGEAATPRKGRGEAAMDLKGGGGAAMARNACGKAATARTSGSEIVDSDVWCNASASRSNAFTSRTFLVVARAVLRACGSGARGSGLCCSTTPAIPDVRV